jgi:hypothetical protein
MTSTQVFNKITKQSVNYKIYYSLNWKSYDYYSSQIDNLSVDCHVLKLT